MELFLWGSANTGLGNVLVEVCVWELKQTEADSKRGTDNVALAKVKRELFWPESWRDGFGAGSCVPQPVV